MLASATCGLVSNVHACVKSSWYSTCCVALNLQPISDRVAALSRHKIRRMMSHVFIVHWLLNLMYRSSPTGEDIVRQWSTYGRQIEGTLPSIQRLWGTQFSFDLVTAATLPWHYTKGLFFVSRLLIDPTNQLIGLRTSLLLNFTKCWECFICAYSTCTWL